MKPPVFIIGYMACGKTTLGRALAKKLNREFIDLDFYIEQRFRTTISEIFEKKGESYFRKLETNMLQEVGEMQDVIVACGGGTPCFNGNMDYMLSHGETLFLEASEERILQRLLINRERRPLMATKTETEVALEIKRGLSARMAYYNRAKIRHCGEELESVKQISQTIESLLELHPEL